MTDDEINAVAAAIHGRPYASEDEIVRAMTAILEVAARELSSRGIALYLPEYGKTVSIPEIPKVFGWIAQRVDR